MNNITKEPVRDAEVLPGDEEKETGMEVVEHEHRMPSYILPNAHQIAEYEEFLNNYDEFIGRMLTEDVDYGVIPGVAKPSLFKPGAEKLEKLFFLRSKKECILKEVREDGSFIRYTYRTTVFNKNGQVVATCEGTCNSHEKKYRWNTVFDNQATEEQKKEGKKEVRKARNGGREYTVYVIEKKEFYDMENTIMKMAQKRSYVGAILEATNSSGRFTQDVEDLPADQLGATAPAQVPAKPAGVTPAMFTRVKNSILKMEDVNALEETKKKIEKSDKYTDEQRKELVELIDEGVKAIKA